MAGCSERFPQLAHPQRLSRDANNRDACLYLLNRRTVTVSRMSIAMRLFEASAEWLRYSTATGAFSSR